MEPKQNKEGQRGHKGSGFSLIELLIVVAIILIIAAIAIPNLLRARMAANQTSAIESCRTVTSAETIYYTLYNGFAPSFAALGGPAVGTPTATNAQLIDDVLSSGTKSGYSFTYAASDLDAGGNYQGFSVNADPLLPEVTGVTHYYTDEPFVIHENPSGTASASDPPIE